MQLEPQGDQYEEREEADRVAFDVVLKLRSQSSESDGPGPIASYSGVRRSTLAGPRPIVSKRLQAKALTTWTSTTSSSGTANTTRLGPLLKSSSHTS